MAEQFQTSFIPKKAVETQAPQGGFSGAGIASFIGILSLVVSVALAGGVFAYDIYLNNAITRKEAQLQQQRDAFAPEVIRDMSRLSTKISVSENLLTQHIATSEIFNLLQALTLQTVRFTSFSFSTTEKGIQVTMQGEGLSFTSVALQADEFARNANFTGTVFSSFALNNVGNVTFSVITTVNPKIISYPESVTKRGTAVMDVPVQPVATVPQEQSLPAPEEAQAVQAPETPEAVENPQTF